MAEIKLKAYRVKITMEVMAYGRNWNEARDNARGVYSLASVEYDTHADERDWIGYPQPLNCKDSPVRREESEDIVVDDESFDF